MYQAIIFVILKYFHKAVIDYFFVYFIIRLKDNENNLSSNLTMDRKGKNPVIHQMRTKLNLIQFYKISA